MKKKINQWACYNRIWSWSPMPCEKHGPRASVTTKTSAFGLGFCLLSPSDNVFHKAWETMIKSYIIDCSALERPCTKTTYVSCNHHALTHWGRVTHICVSKLTIIGSDNGLSPGRRQAIIWTNAGILLIIGIDHDTVCAGVVGTAIRNSMSCAGRRAAACGRLRPAQQVLFRIAVPTTTAQTV